MPTLPRRLLSAALLMIMAGSATPALALKVGRMAPLFKATDIDGKPVTLGGLHGKFVVLEWHNKGCPFVVKHYGSGNLPALQAKWMAKGVAWISIISSSEGKQGFVTAEEAREDITATHATLTAMILDQDGSLGKSYGAKCTPHMFIINPMGRLIYNGALDDHPTADPADIPGSVNYVDKALTEALAGKPISIPSTTPYGCGIKYKKG